RGGLRGHDRRGERARRRHGREPHEGEEALERPPVHGRGARPADPEGAALARAGARVHPRGRGRRGDAGRGPAAQGAAVPAGPGPRRAPGPPAEGGLTVPTTSFPDGTPTPMLAVNRDEMPVGEGWTYEPKWDGFRTIVAIAEDGVDLVSRTGRPLARYFPEVQA